MADERLLRAEIDTETYGHVAVVSVHGEVDLTTAPEMSDAIGKALASSPSVLIVDLSDVEFLASVGMSVLITARRDADDTVEVVVVADGPATRRPMELVGLNNSIPMYTDFASALASVNANEGGRIVALPTPNGYDEGVDAEEGIA